MPGADPIWQEPELPESAPVPRTSEAAQKVAAPQRWYIIHFLPPVLAGHCVEFNGGGLGRREFAAVVCGNQLANSSRKTPTNNFYKQLI